jgi:hypothetical protein
VSLVSGWVARLGHVRGRVFMFDVSVGGEHSVAGWFAQCVPSRS